MFVLAFLVLLSHCSGHCTLCALLLTLHGDKLAPSHFCLRFKSCIALHLTEFGFLLVAHLFLLHPRDFDTLIAIRTLVHVSLDAAIGVVVRNSLIQEGVLCM